MKTGIELFEYNMRLGVRNQKTGTRHYWVGHLTNGCFGKFGSKLCFCFKKKKSKSVSQFYFAFIQAWQRVWWHMPIVLVHRS